MGTHATGAPRAAAGWVKLVSTIVNDNGASPEIIKSASPAAVVAWGRIAFQRRVEQIVVLFRDKLRIHDIFVVANPDQRFTVRNPENLIAAGVLFCNFRIFRQVGRSKRLHGLRIAQQHELWRRRFDGVSEKTPRAPLFEQPRR
jgi:hypothetical protein